MKLGLQLNSFDWDGGPERFGRNLVEIGAAAEVAGFDRIGVADHLWQHPIMGGPDASEPECYATLAFLAANTARIGLTAMVSGVHFRHPAVLVKAVTGFDERLRIGFTERELTTLHDSLERLRTNAAAAVDEVAQ